MGLLNGLSKWLPDPTIHVPAYRCEDCGLLFEMQRTTCPDCDGRVELSEDDAIPVYWGPM